MKPDEFRDWITRHNFNPGQAAQFLEIDRKTVDRYLDGMLVIPRRIELACWSIDEPKRYRLTPIDISHTDWRASGRLPSPIVLRAPNPQLARWRAAEYRARTRTRKGEDVSAENPWLQVERVTVEEIADNNCEHPPGATYVLDFENRQNRAALESAKPSKDIRVLVRTEENRSAPAVAATGRLTPDSKVFDVFVDGQHSHSWNWKWLQEKLGQYR